MDAPPSVERAALIPMEDDEPLPRGIESAGWVAFGIGVALALLTEAWPLLRVLVGYMVVLVHEIGHALAGWIFGYPSLPAFDFRYGGGVTLHQEQSWWIVAGVFGLLAGAVWVFRANRASRCWPKDFPMHPAAARE